jgi:hypothetical protein
MSAAALRIVRAAAEATARRSRGAIMLFFFG